MNTTIQQLTAALRAISPHDHEPYRVPALWVGATGEPVTFASGTKYLLHQLSVIEELRQRPQRTWTHETTVVYGGLVRHMSAYAHGSAAWRDAGTFISVIGMLPYLHSLQVNTLHLLPVTRIGALHRKGTAGSPYAIRDPHALDENLAEPFVPLSVDEQFSALVACCHALGIRVVVEVALRTASMDSVLAKEHPEWFYWIEEQTMLNNAFRAPEFTTAQIALATRLTEAHQYHGLPEPPEAYRTLFREPPIDVYMDANGWRGRCADDTFVRIPGAFADWPINDPQPPWSDVTYLRLHDHPDLRYMAYNTIRMFDSRLLDASVEQRDLWNMIADIVPSMMRRYDIDGTMIDMGHALPSALQRQVIDAIRAQRDDAIIWEENFHLTEASVAAGYTAAMGYLPLDARDEKRCLKALHSLDAADLPQRFFATTESHNTPRSAAHMPLHRTIGIWKAAVRSPRAIAYLHAGVELGEHVPVNTGLEFTPEEQAAYPPELLPLFSDAALPWDAGQDVVPAWRTAITSERPMTAWE
jgi:glycosidase